MTSSPGSARANAALVLESVEALNAGDTARLLAVVAPDIVIHHAELPEPLHGRDSWQQGFELMKRAFPDLEARVEDVVAAGDRVAVRLSFAARTRASFRTSLPAAGRSATSATSSTAWQRASSPRSGSAPTRRRSSAS